MLCQECSKKPNCTELCEETEKYVSQDHVAQRESPKPEWLLDALSVHVTLHRHPDIVGYFQESGLDFKGLTPLQNKILHMFYFDGLSYKQIARALSGNRSKTKINQSDVRYQLHSGKQLI